jgi:hypothetical protein
MVTTHRLSTTGALIVCLVATQWTGMLFASEQQHSSGSAPLPASVVSAPFEALAEPPDSTVVSASEPIPTATALRPSTVEATRLVLSGEPLVTSPPLGIASSRVWGRTPLFAPFESDSLAQPGGYRGRGRGSRNGAAQAEIVLGAIASIAGGAILVYANRPECSANSAASGCGYGTKVAGTAVLSAGLVALLVGAITWR